VQEDAANGMMIFLIEPRADETVGGRTAFSADVPSQEDEEVVFLVDNRVVARFREPPFRTVVDLDIALEHRFEVLVLDDGDEVGHRERTLPGVRIDEQVDLSLMQLYVTVLREGTAERALPRDRFSILDQGARQEIVTFEGGDAAITAALLIDSSLSMGEGRLALALESAEALLSGFRELDECSVFLFADRVFRYVPTRQEPLASLRALRGAQPAGGSAIHDALYRASRELEARQGRRVLVLLSDGIDVHSALRAEQLRWALRRGNSVVYWIRLGTPGERHVSAWRGAEEHDEQIEELTKAVEESGGRILPISRIDQAREAFRTVLEELRSQYVIGYYPNNLRHDGAWHNVRVRVEQSGVFVRSRAGYIDR
jgi:Ca-activated chloride channel homolog